MAVDAPVLANILVSGGTGFVGLTISSAIAEKHLKCNITVLDVKPPDSTHFLSAGISFIQADITCSGDINNAVRRVKPEAFIHKVGIVPVLGERLLRKPWMVLEASSSSTVTCALRPSVLCGPGDNHLVPPIHACIAEGETPFMIGDGLNLWDVTYVTNVADAHVLAAENLVSTKTAAGEAFFIQNNEPVTFRTFCLAVWAHFGHIPPFQVHIPEPLPYMAGLVSKALTWAMETATTLSRGSIKDACSVRYASGEKAKRILGLEARIGIEDAIRLSCEDYARRLGAKSLPRTKNA
ncbi:hypothetical protein MAP00_008968 [Monascus purpureus]|nr:hypothetical protein MAP00_008968 [Monascus purpureus]